MQSAFGAAVQQVTNGLPGEAHVVEQLGFVFRDQLFTRFQLDHNCVADKQIGKVLLLDLMAFVRESEQAFRFELGATKVEFDF